MATGAAIAGVVVGGAGLAQSKKAGDKAESSSDMAMMMSLNNLQFNQDQLSAWETQFGGLEQNLTDYYSNLDPTKFAMEGKQNLQSSMDKQMKQFNESMSAQGMQTSGMRAQAEKEAAFGMAEGNAAIDMAAPEAVAQMQGGYLNSKEHRRTNAIGGVSGAMGGTQNMLGQQAGQYGASQAGWMGMAGSAIGAGIGAGFEADW